MSTTPSNIECTDCGAPIDATTDAPDKPAPCPKCGSVRRTVKLTASGMQPSNYMLDNFVAHKLSLLTECGACELSANANWIGAFELTSLFRAQLPPKKRAYVFNFLRRSEGVFPHIGKRATRSLNISKRRATFSRPTSEHF
jgi:hypothetical protein